jgi:N-methylhydantoinase A
VGLGDPAAASAAIRDAFAEVEHDLAADLRERGIAPADLVFEHRVRMRYRGQMNELTVAWHVPRPTPDDVADLARLFAKTYGQRYGLGAVRMQAVPEITDFRVDALVVDPDVATTWRVDQALEADPGPGTRSVFVPGRGRVDVPVRRLVGLAEGDVVEGPAVVEGPGTSIWLPPGTHGVPDARGDLHITGWAA